MTARLAVGLRRHGFDCEACFLTDQGGAGYFRSVCPTIIVSEIQDGRSITDVLVDLIRSGSYDGMQYSYVREMPEALALSDYPGIVVEVDHGWSVRWQAGRVRPDAAVAVSHEKARVLRELGAGVEVRVIHNGVDVDRLQQVTAAVGATVARPPRSIVAWVGRIDPGKRPWLFLQLAVELLSRRDDLECWMIGSLTSFSPADQVEAAIRVTRGYPRFRYSPGIHPAQMPLLYGLVRASGGAIVLTSQDESLPLVPIEAMACGIPVIAPRVGGVPEIIDHGVDGILLDEPFSVREAAHAISDLLADPRGYEMISCHARKKATSQFGLDAMLRNYRDLYADLCGWSSGR